MTVQVPLTRGAFWHPLIGRGILAYRAARTKRLSDLGYWQRETARIQASQLRALLSAASATVFGRQHAFGKLAAIADDAELVRAYRAEVPIADWYAYKDLIARMREGAEPDVLWPGLVEDFAQTSGTTAGDKFIPVSAAMMRSNFRASLDIFSHMARFGVSVPELTSGKSLFLGGSTELSKSANGIRTGDLSGIVTPLIRWPISEIYLPGSRIALLSHWPTKIDAMARRCIDEDIRMMSGMPSWALVVCERVLQLARERGMESRFPGREGQGVSALRDVWPNLTIFVHGGVKYGPFEPRVRQIYSGAPGGPDVPFRLELYPASEAFVALQDTRGDAGLRLCADIGNFVEFVPLEEINEPGARGFACWEVEKGQKYVVTLSTCAGLWRYVLGDVVEFDTIPAGLDGRGGEGPSRLRIVGRHRHFINAFGENLIVEHIENAVEAAAKAAGLLVGEFTAAPVYPRDGSRAGLELAVEVEQKPDARSIAAFGEAFDAALKHQNVDYTTKRTDGLGMTEPTITPLPVGAFHRWMESRGKLGGQHKCPRCANSREIIEAVKAASGV
jgi:hypothetical protein